MIEERGTIFKTYIVLVTRVMSRAIYLELVRDLKIGTFLNASRRFMARRRIPTPLQCQRSHLQVGIENPSMSPVRQ